MRTKYAVPSSPFPTFGYFGPGYFCDREEELSELKLAFEGNIPILLSGIRRLGKSGLLHHFIYHLKNNQVGVYVDLLDASDMKGLVSKLSEAILRAFPEGKKYKTIWDTIKKLRPTISFDEFSGLPQVSLSLSSEQEAEKSLSNIMDSLSARPERIVLILDEFQQVINFDDSHVESILRSEMQRHPTLHYIFSGSKTHLLSRIFQEAGRPFYGMVQSLHLNKLDKEVYLKFIIENFSEAGKSISNEIVDKVINWTDAHTYYTQSVCNQLFLISGKTVKMQDLTNVMERIIKSHQHDFFQIKDLLSPGQWKTLVAISLEEKFDQPFAQKVTRKYDLGNSNAVRKALAVLLDKQLIHMEFDEKGDKSYQSTNPFLTNWIKGASRI